jgi:iron complex outermembrane receptor protein
MHTRILLLACLTAIVTVTLTPVAALAQSLTNGTVAGRVSDPSGGIVVGAQVRLEAAAGGSTSQALTDSRGEFKFERLAPGPYLLIITHPGLAPDTRAVDIVAGEPTAVSIQLQAAGVRENVLVTATRVATPLSSIPNTVTIVDAQSVDRRTARSDDLSSLLEANVPGFAPSLKKLTGRGETLRGRNPLYTINGVPQHAPLRDGERDGHTIDLDFIDRVEVIHGANAIQGIGATGGVVNMVTKSPRADGAWTQDIKLSVGNGDGFASDGWSSKVSYLLGKRIGAFDFISGVAVNKRELFHDATGQAIGLYPTQGDIMDSTSRGFYTKAGYTFSPTRRLEISANHFRLERDGDYVAVPGNRATGTLSTTIPGDPRPVVGDPARNDATTISVDYRDRNLRGGEASLQAYAADSRALFEGGAFTTFSLVPGGPAFLDQSAINTRKFGVRLTYALPHVTVAGISPTVGFDVSQDRSGQTLARTGRTWVPETTFREAAPYVQLQRLIWGRVLVSGGARFELATVRVEDFTTLPSSRSTFVAGGSPTFTEVLPNIGAVVPVNERLSLYTSFSEGFTMPDVGRVLRAVNVPGQDVESLVDIQPVVAGNIEVGADYRLGRARLHSAYYRSNSERGSLLDRDSDGVFHVRRQPTTIHGVDVGGRVDLGRSWSAGGTYAWIQGRFDSNSDGARDTDLDGLNIAPNRLNLFVDGPIWNRLDARVQASTLFDRRFEGLAAVPGRDFRGYTTVDMSLAFEMAPGTLRLGVENLLDKQYVIYFSQVETAAGNDTFFAGQGRGFTLSLERRF